MNKISNILVTKSIDKNKVKSIHKIGKKAIFFLSLLEKQKPSEKQLTRQPKTK
jgi:hypothetical protein